APAHPVLRLAGCPDAHIRDDGFHLLPGPLFTVMVGRVGLAARQQLLLPQFLVGVLAHGLPFGLRLVEISFEFVLALGDPSHDGGIDGVHIAAFIEHWAGDSLTRNQAFELLYGKLGRQQVFDLLADVVVEFPDAVVLVYIEVNGQIRNPRLILVFEPRSRSYLLAYAGDDLGIGLDFVLQAVERLLQFSDELIGKIAPAGSQARGLQVGNHSNLIAAGLDRHVFEVPPGRFGFAQLHLLLMEFSGSREPLPYKTGKAVFFKNADPVKI